MITKEFLQSLPQYPGVYIMKDAGGTILYIGKASSLRSRVSSYFQNRPRENRIEHLRSKVDTIEFIVCDSEAQALLLEASLIKEKKPYYNIELKDDKSFPYLVVTNERFPRIHIARTKHKPDARRIGPFPGAKALRQALKMVRVVVPFRSCKNMPASPCLFFHLKKCPGVCTGTVAPDVYRRMVEDIVMLFSGEKDKLLADLRARMDTYARSQRYEDAKQLRDRMNAFQDLLYGNRNPVNQLAALQKVLRISKHLARIEGYDISSLGTKEAVGSQVCFIEGLPAKNFYRRYRIKQLRFRDDLGMMREVLSRRFRRLTTESKQSDYPDLVIVDGGLVHAALAKKVLESFHLYDMNVIGIAKKHEEIWFPSARKPIVLDHGSPALTLIQRIRDEAHRFARAYHIWRRKKAFMSNTAHKE